MKRKLILLVLLTLIAWPGYSQRDTIKPVKLSIYVGQRILIDLEELDQYRLLVPLLEESTANLKEQIRTYKEIDKERVLQNELLNKNIQLLKVQLIAEKAKKPKLKTTPIILAIIGAAGLGFIAGSM
jgi:hypothetical protein